jgi:cell division septation protein DedD
MDSCGRNEPYDVNRNENTSEALNEKTCRVGGTSSPLTSTSTPTPTSTPTTTSTPTPTTTPTSTTTTTPTATTTATSTPTSTPTPTEQQQWVESFTVQAPLFSLCFFMYFF